MKLMEKLKMRAILNEIDDYEWEDAEDYPYIKQVLKKVYAYEKVVLVA